METSGHVKAFERFLALESLLYLAEHRHFHLRPLDPKLPFFGQAEVFYVVVQSGPPYE